MISSYAYAWIAYFGNDSDWNGPFKLTVFFESIFTLSILLKFITTFIEEGETVPESNHTLIYQNYRDNGGMYSDLVAWIPIVFIFDCSKAYFYRLIYLIKIIRIYKALDWIDVVIIMGHIKGIMKK